MFDHSFRMILNKMPSKKVIDLHNDYSYYNNGIIPVVHKEHPKKKLKKKCCKSYKKGEYCTSCPKIIN